MRTSFAKLQTCVVGLWRGLVNRRRLALLLLPFGLATGRAAAADDPVLWTPVHQKPTDRTRLDLELTLRARRLLVEDPALARYDIQVRIDDRVAELSGQVPSMEIAQQAETSLRGLFGLASIRNRLAIDGAGTAAGAARPQLRVDWRTVPLETNTMGGPVPQLASRYSAISGEPVLSWRPVRPAQEASTFAVPFIPEGIGRPNVIREQLHEFEATNRNNLRIGRVDVIKSPAEPKQEPEASLLPPVDIRFREEAPVRQESPGLLEQIRSRIPFVGF
jgi:hypothetical protein